MRRAWLVALALIVASCGAVASTRAATAHKTTTLIVFAAASLTDAFGDLAHRFERSHPAVAVRLSFAGSQQLEGQLAEGARADVFASADTQWMSAARSASLVDGEPRAFAGNRLIVLLPASNPARVDRLDQLARPGVKLVMCAATVPAGRYGRDLLARLETLPACGPGWSRRVLANVVSEEDNVRAVVGKVALGEADAGIVYRTDVTPSVRRVTRTLGVPDSLDVPAVYPIAALRNAPAGDLGRAFVDYVCSAEGRRILAGYGFLPPPTP
jgi:molybdate transport system substrate-binding protein